MTVKPMVGLVDVVTRTTQAITYTTSTSEQKTIRRFRPQRHIGPDKMLQAYSWEQAFGQMILYKQHEGKNISEWYLQHFTINNSVLVLSDQQIICLNRSNSYSFKWSVTLKSTYFFALIKSSNVFTRHQKD